MATRISPPKTKSNKPDDGGDKAPAGPIAKKPFHRAPPVSKEKQQRTRTAMLVGSSAWRHPEQQLERDLGKELPKNLKPHPLARKFRPYSDDEFNALVEDLRDHGQQFPIILYEGMILDGVNRHKAALKAGIKPRGKPFTGFNPAAFVCSANVHRRHLDLTSAKKRELIAQVLKESPELSDRKIAKITKTSHPTVAAERDKLEGTGKISSSEKRIGADGKSRSTKKSKPTPVQLVITSEPREITAIETQVLTDAEVQDARRAAYTIKNGEPRGSPALCEAVDRLIEVLGATPYATAVCDMTPDQRQALLGKVNTARRYLDQLKSTLAPGVMS